MEELVKLVSQKVGISEAQARQAVDIVLNFVKARLPAPLAAQVDSFIEKGPDQDMLKGLGGLFGNK